MKSLKILIIAGGNKHYYDLSIKSSENIKFHLEKAGHTVSIIELKNDIEFLKSIISNDSYDCIFNGLCYYDSFFGALKNLLKFFKIKSTHSDVLGFEISNDKIRAIKEVESLGILCPLSYSISLKEYKQSEKSKNYIIKTAYYTLFKPFLVNSLSVKNKALTFYEQNNCQKLLMQEYVKGEDIYVLVVCGNALGATSITPCGYNTIIKQQDYSDYYVKLMKDSELSECLQHKAELIYSSIGLKGIACVHFKYDKQNIYFLSINAAPDLHERSVISQMCKIKKINMIDILNVLIHDAMQDENIMTHIESLHSR